MEIIHKSSFLKLSLFGQHYSIICPNFLHICPDFVKFLLRFLNLFDNQLLMYDFVPYLSFLTSGIGLWFVLYLLFRFSQYLNAFVLAFIVFSVVYMEFYIYALTSKHIYRMLFLYRSSNIFRAFLPMALYTYVWRMLHPKTKFNAWYALHWVFPLGITLGLMPDLLQSSKEKVAILDAYYQHNETFLNRPAGFIPAGWMQPMSILVGMGYGLGVFAMVKVFKKRAGANFTYVNQQNLRWMELLSMAIALYFILQYYQYLNLFFNHNFNPPSQIIKGVVGIGLFAYFLNSPNVQENMDGCVISADDASQPSYPSLSDLLPRLLTKNEATSIAQLESILLDQGKLLDPGMDLAQLAKAMDMSSNKLSNAIKQWYGITFVEFINRRKIHYFLTHFNHFDRFTLETFIYQSGFKNRSTFYAAFKKYIGVNPSFYLKEIEKKRV